MFLKKLEMIGFKSFAERTDFVFHPGVTCIVGPNGCGKSNVVDAFKWIFGAQSAKGLRGSEMKDVIFNGTVSRKPTGFAEVTVTFDNADGYLPIDYAEVAITRRLYRSGESEYLINKQRCRLKDIKELLLDTGIGTTSYSILEQGKIDVLLQASNLDRRIIFEEAAGISKYRVKKAESLRALMRVQDNLSRLQDIIDEVEKRVRRVKVQAGKARRYKEYSERLKELRIRLALEDYSNSVTAATGLSFGLFWCGHRLRRLEDLSSRLNAGLETQLEKRRVVLRGMEELREALSGERILKERTEERIRQSHRRKQEIVEQRTKKKEDLEATRGGLDKLRANIEAERSQLDRLTAEIRARGERLATAVAGVRQLEEAQNSREADLARSKTAVVDSIQQMSRIANQVVQISSELGNLEARKERLTLAMGRFTAELEDCKARQAGWREQLEEITLRRSSLEADRARLEESVRGLEEEIKGVETELAGRQEELHKTSSRCEVLRSFEEDLDGVASGVAEVMRCRDQLSPGARTHGMVASLVRVDRPYARAVESILGERAQALVMETQEGGMELLDFARQTTRGGVQVIPLDRVDSSVNEYFPKQGGVLGPLRDKVTVEDAFSELLDRLLSNVVLVEDFATAVALSRNGLRPFRLVTLAGEVIEPWGALSVPGDTDAGLISRRSEMEELQSRVEVLEEECASLGERLGSLKTRLAAGRDAVRGRLSDLESLERRRVVLDGQLAQDGREVDRLERELAVGISERSEIEGEMKLRAEEKKQREAEQEEVETARSRVEERIRELEQSIEAAAGELQGASKAAADARLELAQAEKQEEGLREMLHRQSANLAEREKHVADLLEEIESLARRHGDVEKTIEESGRELNDVRKRETGLEAELERREAEDRGLVEIEAGFRQELEKVRNRAAGISREKEGIQLREQEERHRRNTVLERIDEEYGIDLKALVSRGRGTPDPDGTAGGDGEPLESEGYLVGVPDWDRDAARAEAKELQAKIRKLGNVNLEALDELEELEERFEFQSAQKKDLTESERNLRQIIAEINEKSRVMFLKTFESVQGHFNDLFRKCFGGGKAELVLEEGADVLEAGIEIIARPPGKKLTSLSLMSGGEKTMTTIALLLSIFRSRPSPFCLLDEVDAPLDETNVRRFVVLLDGFLAQSQFILITHNKITMASGSTLYGVTMQERGVSKKVAVELESYDPETMEMAAAK